MSIRIVGTQPYAVVACCGQHGQNVLSEIYEEWGNTGNGMACCFQHCQPGLPARQRASGSHTPRRSRAKSLNAQIRSLNRASQSGDRRSSTTSRVICFWYGFASPVTRNPVRCSGIQYQPIQFGAVEILLSDAQHHMVFRLFRMTGQEPAEISSVLHSSAH